MNVWYRQLSPTSWVAYRDNQAIHETTTRGALVDWLRENFIEADWRPLRIYKVL